LALADVALPYVNAFLDSAGRLDFAHDAPLVAAAVAGIIVVGVLAGAYPAFVLSAFRPSAVLKGSALGPGGDLARKSLVVMQFAVLIGLLIGATVIYRQHLYATRATLRVDTDQMLILRSPCRPVVLNELRALPGVRGANCATEPWLDRRSFLNARLQDGSVLAIDSTALDFGVFELYGIKPLAGRLPPDDQDSLGPTQNAAQIVINESAARIFGFGTPAAAIGRRPPFVGGEEKTPSEIVAVVPDFAFDAGLHKVRPALYEGSTPDDRARYGLISVKLRGRDIPETLEAIDRISAATENAGDSPPERFFLNQYIESLYLAVLREAQVLGIFAAVAIVLACLGLVGLSAATAESRTREIGIRKALGADSTDILQMLLWQFSKPILWANLIAWPVSAFLLYRWLEGFADHVDLSPLTFVAAGAAALIIALVTVAAHASSVARAKPVEALRYE
jgi:putative ABC transport system permease protein